MPELNVLAIGDIVGSPGRKAVTALLPKLVAEEKIGFVVANAENAAGGSGLTPAIVAELLGAGCHVLTSGDHVFKNRDVLNVIDKEPRLLRPANFPKRAGAISRSYCPSWSASLNCCIRITGWSNSMVKLTRSSRDG
jgi:calcineurin-like phosphoesterase